MPFSYKTILYSFLLFFAFIFTYFYFDTIKPESASQIEAQNTPDDVSFVKSLIQNHYYKPIEIDTLDQSSVERLLISLNDPYSFLVESDSQEDDISRSHGMYQGLGIKLIEVDGKPMVITVMPLSSAFEAGIKEGDFLTKINGLGVSEYTPEKFYQALDVNTGQSLDLTFVQNNLEKDLSLIAKEFVLNTVFYSKLEDDLAYVRIILFRPQTEFEIGKMIERLEQEKIKRLVLDLRGNTGGITNGADLLLNNLVELGTLYSQTNSTATQIIEAKGIAKLADLKIAVLIDRGTASRAEIVASALQENNRAVIIGEPSYGKGTIWQAFNLPSGGRIHLTTGQWFTPNGNQIEKVGVKPDILIERPWEEDKQIIEVAKKELE